MKAGAGEHPFFPTAHLADQVLPADPLDPRPRHATPIYLLDCPNPAAFERALERPDVRREPLYAVVEALYGRVDLPVPGEATARGRLQKPWAGRVADANPHLHLDDHGNLRRPVGMAPLYETFSKAPLRAVDWASIRARALVGPDNAVNRYLAVAAHAGYVVAGYEGRVRKGMLEVVHSRTFHAYVASPYIPYLPTDGDLEKLGTRMKRQMTRPDVEAIIQSPHLWGAYNTAVNRHWAYPMYDRPPNLPAFHQGPHGITDADGRPMTYHGHHFFGERQLDLLEGAAAYEVRESDISVPLSQHCIRLLNAGLACVTLRRDLTSPTRPCYELTVTPRGWRTLWAHDRMTHWLERLQDAP